MGRSAKTDKPDNTPPADTPARSVVDRRTGIDRRDLRKPDADHTGLERRRGPGRRLSDFSRSAEEGEMTQEQFLFLVAIDAFKKANGKTFPTWTDVLEVIRLLGYRKTMPSEINLKNAEDWREPPNAPSNVRPDRWEDRFTPGQGITSEQQQALDELERHFGEAA